MSQAVSHFEDRIMQPRHSAPGNSGAAQASDQHPPWERIAVEASNDNYIRRAATTARFGNAAELRVPYKAKPFDDRRCPVCGTYICSGC